MTSKTRRISFCFCTQVLKKRLFQQLISVSIYKNKLLVIFFPTNLKVWGIILSNERQGLEKYLCSPPLSDKLSKTHWFRMAFKKTFHMAEQSPIFVGKLWPGLLQPFPLFHTLVSLGSQKKKKLIKFWHISLDLGSVTKKMM